MGKLHFSPNCPPRTWFLVFLSSVHASSSSHPPFSQDCLCSECERCLSTYCFQYQLFFHSHFPQGLFRAHDLLNPNIAIAKRKTTEGHKKSLFTLCARTGPKKKERDWALKHTIANIQLNTQRITAPGFTSSLVFLFEPELSWEALVSLLVSFLSVQRGQDMSCNVYLALLINLCSLQERMQVKSLLSPASWVHWQGRARQILCADHFYLRERSR